MITKRSIASEIDTQRRLRNWTLTELASRTGLSVSYISDLTGGRTMPSVKTLGKIAKAFGVDLQIIFANPVTSELIRIAPYFDYSAED